jgi:hypothetical protein
MNSKFRRNEDIHRNFLDKNITDRLETENKLPSSQSVIDKSNCQTVVNM